MYPYLEPDQQVCDAVRVDVADPGNRCAHLAVLFRGRITKIKK